MQTHADKKPDTQHKVVAESTSKDESPHQSTSAFVDNRPQAIAQRKLQSVINQSPIVQRRSALQEIANNSPQGQRAVQLKALSANRSREVTQRKAAPAEPLHHKFLTTVALQIYDAAKAKKASVKGALLVMSQASLESGYGKAAIDNKDYNLFGVMGSPSRRRTSHGAVKDYTNSGGYQGAINDYFSRIDKKWSTFDDLIQKDDFTSDDIDQALNTGKYYQFAKERNKNGKFAYNADDIDEATQTNNNKYGSHLIGQMKSFCKRLVNSLDFQINQNNLAIAGLKDKMSKKTEQGISGELQGQINEWQNQNNKFQTAKDELSNIKL